MGEGAQVRRATKDDSAVVARLLHEFNLEFGVPTPGPEVLEGRLRELLAVGSATSSYLVEAPTDEVAAANVAAFEAPADEVTAANVAADEVTAATMAADAAPAANIAANGAADDAPAGAAPAVEAPADEVAAANVAADEAPAASVAAAVAAPAVEAATIGVPTAGAALTPEAPALQIAAVGVAVVTTRRNVWYPGPVALLDELYVAPAYRDRGLGSALISRLIADSTSAGVSAIEINVDEGDTDAQRFYERHGFSATEPDSDERAFYFFREF
jgi:ribosomal protein S18 acetylase RimI-like enzyme